MQEFKLKHLLLKLFEITISYHSSGVNTLQSHFMYKEYGDVHVMQDAQDDRSQICLNYVTKGPNVFANTSR